MASLITELKDTLIEQSNMYTDLLEIASKKKVTIIENNIEKLQEYVTQENMIIGKNQRLDKKRLEIFDDIATVMGKSKDITLKDIIVAIKGQEEEKELKDIREKILNTVEKLKTINDQNQELIQMSMEYVDFTMNVLRDSTSRPTYYDMAGNEINTADKKMFDAKQ